MKIRKCKTCGNKPKHTIAHPSGRMDVVLVFCCGDEMYNVEDWNAANKPDKPSKKDREIARLKELDELSKADLVKATEKIAELTKRNEYLTSILERCKNDNAQYVDKIEEITARNIRMSLENEELKKSEDELEKIAMSQKKFLSTTLQGNKNLIDKVEELTEKVSKLTSENVILHNKLIAAVGVDEAFDA